VPCKEQGNAWREGLAWIGVDSEDFVACPTKSIYSSLLAAVDLESRDDAEWRKDGDEGDCSSLPGSFEALLLPDMGIQGHRVGGGSCPCFVLEEG